MNHNFFYVAFVVCRNILHRPCAADGHCAVGGECPGQVAFVPAGYNFVCNFTETFACQRRAAFKKHLGQSSTAVKHITSDACNALWNGNVGQAGATIKRIISDACNTTWNRDVCQAAAIVKRKLSNAGDTVWNRDTGQAAATIKRKLSNAGDTVWNRDTG